MREEEIKQLEIDKIHWRDLYWEECEKNKRLKEENKKLRSNIEFLHSGEGWSCMERIDELEEENKKLKAEIQEWLNAVGNK